MNSKSYEITESGMLYSQMFAFSMKQNQTASASVVAERSRKEKN